MAYQYGSGRRPGVGDMAGLEMPQSQPFQPQVPRQPAPARVGAYNSGDPFARGVGAGSSALLREGGQYGFFSPGGSERYRMGMRRRLLTQGRSRRNRASVLARLSGMDRMGQQQALQDADQDIAGSTANAFNDFDTSEYGTNRDYFRGLMRDERGYEEQRRREKEARDAENGGFLGGLGSMIGGPLVGLGLDYISKKRK